MVIKIISVLMGIAALLLTFRVDWVLRTFCKNNEPNLNDRLKVKYIALAIAVLAFVIVLLADKL
ncbi:MAG: hypothetical protein Q4G33_01815 [bacterium]|nr:hypothetical protein [bacterium]